MRNCARHYHIKYERDERSRREKYEREFKVDYHRHHSRADDEERRADEKSYHHRDHVLKLVHVCGKSVDESRRAELVEFFIRQFVYMCEQIVSEQRSVALRALGRYVLAYKRAAKTCYAQSEYEKAAG